VLAPGLNRGGPALRLRPWAPASAGATEKEELGTICLVHTASSGPFPYERAPLMLAALLVTYKLSVCKV